MHSMQAVSEATSCIIWMTCMGSIAYYLIHDGIGLIAAAVGGVQPSQARPEGVNRPVSTTQSPNVKNAHQQPA